MAPILERRPSHPREEPPDRGERLPPSLPLDVPAEEHRVVGRGGDGAATSDTAAMATVRHVNRRGKPSRSGGSIRNSRV